MSEFSIGQVIQLNDGRLATIRFIGETAFQVGEWIGVELDDDTGKNDGSVRGERYFDCEPGHGMFVKPAAVIAIEQPAPPPKPAVVPAKRASRPSSVIANGPAGRRTSVADLGTGKRMSMNAASPSPVTRSRPSSMLRSPTKSPTKQLSAATSTTSTPRTGTPSNARTPSVTLSKPRPSLAGTRTSMGPPPPPTNRGPRPSLSGGLGVGNRTNPGAKPAGTRTSLAPKPKVRPGTDRVGSIGSQLSSGRGSEGSGQDTGDEDRDSPTKSIRDSFSPKAVSPVLSRTSAADRNAASPSSTRSAGSSVAPRGTASSTAASREIEELKTKLRVMDKKRSEDRDKLRALEKVEADRDRFEAIIQKLQTKMKSQQDETILARQELKETQAMLADLEKAQADLEFLLEDATVDREMAEEQREVLKTELEALKEKSEELTLEVEVLREENEELGGEMSPEEKTSQGWLQMEREKERMRDALLRLRDMTQQTEIDLRAEIKSLETDVLDLSIIKDKYEVASARLTQSEATVEDLRQQLDNALGAEDMIEDLTERNMTMSEQIEELKATIEDLETLKDLNDELEVNHTENHKAMQEDIDFKDAFITEQARRAAQQDGAIEDLEYTLSRFRELVTNLQSDLEDMRASHAVTETESEQLNSRSRAMMDLNMKLQVSAAKTQVKAIDLELRRLDAQEASEHLAIVQLFLPEAYQTDRDSISALLRFKRVGFKANLLHGFVKERVTGPPPSGHEDDIFAACDVLDKLTWVTAMCDRFVNAISHCSTEDFVRYEGALYELEPVERALNGWIDGLRRDDLNGKQCASELQRTIALMSHLAEVHISSGLSSYADDIHMRTLVMQSHLESAASALSATRVMVQAIVPHQGDEDELSQHFDRKTENAISQTRSAKVIIGKAVRALEDLKTRSLSLPLDTIETFEQCESSTQELADFSRQIGTELHTLLHEEGRAEPYNYLEVQSIVHRTASVLFASSESDLLSTYLNKLRTLTNASVDLAALTSDLDMTQEFELPSAPWVLRSQELHLSKTVPIDAEEEMRRLKDDNHERARLIAVRDQTLGEAAVKIELLESRMRDATKKNERITELERKVEDSKKAESELKDAAESHRKELAQLEAECDKWKKIADDAKAIGVVASGSAAGQERAVATAREMEALKSEISSLQAAVRYLREDSRRARLTDSQSLAWLEAPLTQPKSKEEMRKDLVVAEGNDVLNELLNLTKTAHVYDLSQMPKNRLAWRPAKQTPQYHVAKQREGFEAWNSWRTEVERKGKILTERDANKGLSHTKRHAAARVDLKIPNWEKDVGIGCEVEILEPGEWDGFRGQLGFV